MANYNPHSSRILGQEWVPIREEALTFSPAVNAVEQGYSFVTTGVRTLTDGRFYINTQPSGKVNGQVMMIGIYPQGTEDETGPIKRVVIPCNNGGVTGQATLSGTPTPTSVMQALADPSDNMYIQFNPGASQGQLQMFFATNSYTTVLTNKRILGVNFLYVAAGQFDAIAEVDAINFTMRDNANNRIDFASTQPFQGPLHLGDNNEFRRIRLGEICHFWDTSLSPFNTVDRMPWTATNLARFEASASNRFFLHVNMGNLGVASSLNCYLTYAALEIIYCEEQRVALGGRSFGSGTTVGQTPYILGANPVTMRNPNVNTSLPSLAASTAYTVTLSSADIGDLSDGASFLSINSRYPTLNALREYYSLSTIPGVEVDIPFLVEDHIGDTFTAQSTHVLPQLTLHTSGGPLVEIHPYGRQAAAPVYGSVTAVQSLLDDVVGTNTSFPQVRFYARRFGDTTQALVLDSPNVTGIGSGVSITPVDFDALPEIIDGWREVTLRFTSAPSMGALSPDPQWRWSSSAETAGNQWQVLGAVAPAISGIPGNLLNLVPSPNQLGTATYGEPSSGTTIALTWMSATVTGSTADTTADAVLLFAQDMPTVTGLSVVGATQALTGIGDDCNSVPCCIPSGLRYNVITWTATSSSVPVSGFGYYELQRMDTLTDWATIMQNSSPTGNTFNDYESRVGILTSYRIRAVDVYGFAGSWSSTVTITMSSPGLTGADCVSAGHVLIFTSNERQSGSINLGYATAWENGQVVEDFAFPEAASLALQPMYGKDFFTAFRPTERGGSKFSRVIIVQAAAISPETLPDFTSLRDMAWDQVSYICVRDEDGNRWFANVNVPSAKVLLNRSIYMAGVDITEVTDTPSPVDPNAD